MFQSNINMEQRLVNGSLGTITEIVVGRRDQMYDTDVPSVRIGLGRDGVHLIKVKSLRFPVLRNYGSIERTQLPIILCWACTVHKMQGCKWTMLPHNLAMSSSQEGKQAYVALTRMKSLD